MIEQPVRSQLYNQLAYTDMVEQPVSLHGYDRIEPISVNQDYRAANYI